MVQEVTNTDSKSDNVGHVPLYKEPLPESHVERNKPTNESDSSYLYKDANDTDSEPLADSHDVEAYKTDITTPIDNQDRNIKLPMSNEDDDQGDECDAGDEEQKHPADDDDGLPIDRGWAWMILAGSFLNVILMVGYGRALGVLFVEYLKLFEASATKTTLFMGVMAAFFSIGSLFSMNLILQLFGVRKTVLIGGVISSLGMLTGVFATSITFLICTHSILIGIGHSMIHGPALVLIGQYFKKRRGFATAISMSGISLGGSIYPPLIRYFVDEYGIRGSMLLLTGLTMNMLVGGLLYRPLESFRKRKPKKATEVIKTKIISSRENDDVLPSDTNEEHVDFASKEGTEHPLLSRVEASQNNSLDSEQILRKRVRPLSLYSQTSYTKAVTKGQLEMYRSNPELVSMSMLDITENDESSEGQQIDKPKRPVDYLMMVVKSFDFTLFKHPMFQLIIVISNFSVIFALNSMYLFPYAKVKGIPPIEASFLLTIYGAVDFFSRLAIGYIADLKRIKVHNLIAIGVILAGTATHFVPLYTSYGLLVAYSVFIGLFGSWYNCLIPVFIIELMGQESMAKVLGFVAVFHGLCIALTHPIMGAIIDLTGSYDRCFNYIGACNYIAAICLLCVPLARRRTKTLNKDEEEQVEGKQMNQNCNHNNKT